MGSSDLIGGTEVLEILGGIDRSTLMRRIVNGKLRVAKKVGRMYLFEREEVMRHKREIDASTDRRVTKTAAS